MMLLLVKPANLTETYAEKIQTTSHIHVYSKRKIQFGYNKKK